jgi:hypothetical protein
MKKKKILSVEELKDVDFSKLSKPIYVKIPYAGKDDYICEIKPSFTGGRVVISTEIPPNGHPEKYHLDGVLYWGDESEPTDFGQKVDSFVLNQGLGLYCRGANLLYCRKLKLDVKAYEASKRFIRDVAKVVPLVDRMILDYINNKRSA